jgi:hypothetical protein
MNDDALFYMDVLQALISKRNKPLVPYHANFTVTDFIVTSEGRFKFILNAYAESDGLFYKVSIYTGSTEITCFEYLDGITSNYKLYIVPSSLSVITTRISSAEDKATDVLSLIIELSQLRIDNENLRNQLDRVKKLVCQ